MKRKSYLRGLGVGILITTLVFILVNPSEISDEEVIKRAEQLGYVKAEEQTDSLGIKELLNTITPGQGENVLTEVPKPTATPSPAPETTMALETPVPTPTKVTDPIATSTPVPTETPVPTTEPEPLVVTATIVVEPGSTASAVCDKIEASGIVEDSIVLRDYLINHGLADFINVGTYKLSADMSLKEIAEILTQ